MGADHAYPAAYFPPRQRRPLAGADAVRAEGDGAAGFHAGHAPNRHADPAVLGRGPHLGGRAVQTGQRA
ncbi:hypothetical protein G6F68_021818 [Rhizopus microsporus]|nr:hypothetical protein G6F68_021818 [Rhizopus microsporus]